MILTRANTEDDKQWCQLRAQGQIRQAELVVCIELPSTVDEQIRDVECDVVFVYP
jgi:hypothetical protein